ncbi:hypothetical protein VZT92_026563 [Zoarces viviparus]|uniref:Glycine N-acyltransferase-like protein n=1 Tax=Zoarces viviparus TaxID=48416 RepID=A0AAW1E1Q8_ZOAVI
MRKGRPVSWMLSDELCELRMAFTLPEFRRGGHLLALSLALMSSVGLPVYCHVKPAEPGHHQRRDLLRLSQCGGDLSAFNLQRQSLSLREPNDNNI